MRKATKNELWWYRDQHHPEPEPLWGYLYPFTWPWLLLRPYRLIDREVRYEIYFRGDVVQDLRYYHGETLP